MCAAAQHMHLRWTRLDGRRVLCSLSLLPVPVSLDSHLFPLTGESRGILYLYQQRNKLLQKNLDFGIFCTTPIKTRVLYGVLLGPPWWLPSLHSGSSSVLSSFLAPPCHSSLWPFLRCVRHTPISAPCTALGGTATGSLYGLPSH